MTRILSQMVQLRTGLPRLLGYSFVEDERASEVICKDDRGNIARVVLVYCTQVLLSSTIFKLHLSSLEASPYLRGLVSFQVSDRPAIGIEPVSDVA
jgi:hypothetical protein